MHGRRFSSLTHVIWCNSGSVPVSSSQPLPCPPRVVSSTMLGSIVDKGPSLVVVRDTDGHVFGGYAPESWHCNGDFYGEWVSRHTCVRCACVTVFGRGEG